MTVWPNGSKSRPPISAAYGWRIHPITGKRQLHVGTDFVGFREVRAVEAGTVRVAGQPSGWANGGTQVWIQHDGWFSRSMHLASVAVRNGQWVSEGQLLGIMGATGAVTGIHLHLETIPGALHYSNTGQIDPVTFIQAHINATAGGGGTIIDPDEQEEEEEEMQTRAGFQYKTGDTIGNIVLDTTSGFYHEWYSDGASYNKNTFRGFGINVDDVPTITKKQRDDLLKDTGNVRV